MQHVHYELGSLRHQEADFREASAVCAFEREREREREGERERESVCVCMCVLLPTESKLGASLWGKQGGRSSLRPRLTFGRVPSGEVDYIVVFLCSVQHPEGRKVF